MIKNKKWRGLNVREKAVVADRELRAKFSTPHYRCRYCKVVTDEPSREGHLGRCTEARSATFARGCPLDDHFEAVK